MLLFEAWMGFTKRAESGDVHLTPYAWNEQERNC